MTKIKCGWPEPFLPKKTGVVHCRRCHRQLVFSIHVNQWLHDFQKRAEEGR